MKNCFEIIPYQDAIIELNTFEKGVYDCDYQLKNVNFGFIFELEKDKILFLPSNRIDVPLSQLKGIIFSSVECLDNCIKNKSFPIENPNMTVYENYQDSLFNLKNNSQLYIKSLVEKELGYKIDQFNFDELNGLRNFIKGRKTSKLTAIDYFIFYLCLGETLKSFYNGQWVLEEDYGVYNPYYVPIVLVDDAKLILDIKSELMLDLPSINMSEYFQKNNNIVKSKGYHNYFFTNDNFLYFKKNLPIDIEDGYLEW